MARTEGPREQAEGTELPEQRQEHQPQEEEEQEHSDAREARVMGELAAGTDPSPRITVLGRMDGQLALRLGWRKGMISISRSRFRFLKEDLGMDILDNPQDYLF